jgi:hypothetical protein
MDGKEQQAELPDPDQEPIEHNRPRRGLRRGHEQNNRDRGEQEPQRREHQRRGHADPNLDRNETQAPDDRDAHRREDVARAHATPSSLNPALSPAAVTSRRCSPRSGFGRGASRPF